MIIENLSKSLCYISGFKYQLEEDFLIGIPVLAQFDGIDMRYFSINNCGTLLLKVGFASDGPSGPTIDTPNSIRGSFIHDALYECMRKGYIPIKFRKKADEIIREVCIMDGMSKIRAYAWYYALRWFGARNAKPSRRREIKYAP